MNPKVDKIINDLYDDYTRQGGSLKQSQVDRMLLKRDATSLESLFIYKELSNKGIEIDLDKVLNNIAEVYYDNDDVEAEVPESSSTSTDITRTFINSISNFKMLYHEDEIRLGKIIEQGNKIKNGLRTGEICNNDETKEIIARSDKARAHFIQSNLKLVIHVAKHYNGYTELDLLDLIQEGTIGLMKAVEKYDYYGGN